MSSDGGRDEAEDRRQVGPRDDVRAAAVRIGPADLAIGQGHDGQQERDGDRDLDRQQHRRGPTEDQDAQDLLGRVGRRRDRVGTEDRERLLLVEPLLDVRFAGQRTTEHDPARAGDGATERRARVRGGLAGDQLARARRSGRTGRGAARRGRVDRRPCDPCSGRRPPIIAATRAVARTALIDDMDQACHRRPADSAAPRSGAQGSLKTRSAGTGLGRAAGRYCERWTAPPARPTPSRARPPSSSGPSRWSRSWSRSLEAPGCDDASPSTCWPSSLTAVVAGTWPAVVDRVRRVRAYDFLFVAPRFTLTVTTRRSGSTCSSCSSSGSSSGGWPAVSGTAPRRPIAREREATAMFRTSFALASRRDAPQALPASSTVLADASAANGSGSRSPIGSSPTAAVGPRPVSRGAQRPVAASGRRAGGLDPRPCAVGSRVRPGRPPDPGPALSGWRSAPATGRSGAIWVERDAGRRRPDAGRDPLLGGRRGPDRASPGA